MVERKEDKTVHLDKDLHRVIDMYSSCTGEKIVDIVKKLILDSLKDRKEEIPDYIYSEIPFGIEGEMPKDKKENIQTSDLSEDVITLSERLEGGKVASDQSIRNITLSCLRYLKDHKEGTHKDFKKNVYPDFEEDFKEDSFWKIAKEGLKQIEELNDLVKTPRGRGHYKYVWKG